MIGNRRKLFKNQILKDNIDEVSINKNNISIKINELYLKISNFSKKENNFIESFGFNNNDRNFTDNIFLYQLNPIKIENLEKKWISVNLENNYNNNNLNLDKNIKPLDSPNLLNPKIQINSFEINNLFHIEGQYQKIKENFKYINKREIISWNPSLLLKKKFIY